MSSLGIYFGPKIIRVVETKGKKVLNNIHIDRSLMYPGGQLEEKVPEELKMVALFNEEFRKNKIAAQEVNIALSGKDLIIRNFEMPLLSRQELETAVNFEVKKYIPFKVEDLVSDFQLKFDRASSRNLVLFTGIKKETIEKYLSIFSQLNIKTNILEYSAFSVLRFLKLTGLRERGIIAVISLDLQEEDETNFMVLENGFPLFSRDITLIGGPEEFTRTQEVESAAILEKLKTEIRVSLDYYHRKFPAKKIERAFFVSSQGQRSDLEVFIKELGLSAQFIDVNRYIDKSIPYSLSFIKGYGCSLSKIIRTPLRINLLTVKAKIRPLEEKAAEVVGPLFEGLRVSAWTWILGLSICGLILLFLTIYKIQPLQQELKNTLGKRPPVSTVNPDSSYEELVKKQNLYKSKVETIGGLVKKEIYVTQLLDALPRIMPEGIWLVNLAFRGEAKNRELTLDGMSYLNDNSKELELVNKFLSNLKANQSFSGYFKEITLVSADTKLVGQKIMTHFTISCQNIEGRR